MNRTFRDARRTGAGVKLNLMTEDRSTQIRLWIFSLLAVTM